MTVPSERPELSLVVPWCLRATDEVPGAYAALQDLQRLGVRYEVVVVDAPAANHAAPPLAGRVPAGVPTIRVPFNPLRGVAFFLEEAVEACRGEWTLVADPNLAYQPGQIQAIWAQRANGEIVIASKFHPAADHEYPALRRGLLAVYRWGTARLFGVWVDDPQPAVKLYRTARLRQLLQRALFKPFVFDLELLVIALRTGACVTTAPLRLRRALLYLPWQPFNIVRIALDTLSVWYRARVQRYYDRNQRPVTETPMVSIVIPCVAPSARLTECLESCGRLAYPAYEIIVLPDAPCPVAGARVSVVPTGPVPPGVKRDLGVRRANGTLIAFLDDDAAPARGWLARAIPYFSDERVAGVGGPAITPANDTLRQVCSGAVYNSILVTGTKQYRYIPEPARDVEELPTSNLIVRKRDLLQVGGFDTSFWPGEDTIVCMKLTRQLAKRIVYDPDVLVFHHRRPLFGPHLRQILRYAEHRGYFVRRFRALGFRLSYCLPTMFTIAVVSAGPVVRLWPATAAAYAAGLVVYGAIALTYGLRAGNLRMSALIVLGTVATHVTYGIYFLKGLLVPRLSDDRRPA
ncbi:MAG: glycosyltransferase [Candidatus Omnitrophica bacterium]|nr:glycosyltransferase [Candidatus Omnitrophota bacterium]